MVTNEEGCFVFLFSSLFSSIAFTMIAKTMPGTDMALPDRHFLPAFMWKG